MKNVVRVSGFYEGRTENVSTRRCREEQPRPRTNPSQRSNSVRNLDKENTDMEAGSMETQNQNSNISAKISENPTPPFQDHRNKGEYFAQKLKEIDKDLGIYEEPPSTEFCQKEASPLFDMENLRVELAINKNVVLTPPREHHNHAKHAAPLRDISNYSHTPTNSEIFPRPKWKQLIRVNTGSVSSNEDPIGAKRSMNGTNDVCELPCKKLQVSHEGRENFSILVEAIVQPHQEP